MGSNQSNTAKEIQTITNNIFEDSSEVCIAKCTAIQSGDTIIISGSTTGNVTLTNQCEASASCAMNQQLDSQVADIMKALAQQTNTSSSIWPVSFKFDNKNNSVTIRQAITNNITQIMESICQSTDTNIQENDVIVFTDSEGGNITLSNQGSANSTCTLNNVARQVVFNQQTAKTNQTNKMTSIFTTILVIVVIVLIIGALLVLLIIGPIGIKNLMGSSDKGKGDGESDSGTLQQLLGGGGEGGAEGEGGEGGLGTEAAISTEAEGGLSVADLAILA
uniref:Lipid membrane protein n=1 Tax=Pithovirus LCPAC201 TaxID=2506591 RepID=A0A481Z722_9VIRU|nr:MAG: lipid membrane protein [Pithovirus LCPAC201]